MLNAIAIFCYSNIRGYLLSTNWYILVHTGLYWMMRYVTSTNFCTCPWRYFEVESFSAHDMDLVWSSVGKADHSLRCKSAAVHAIDIAHNHLSRINLHHVGWTWCIRTIYGHSVYIRDQLLSLHPDTPLAQKHQRWLLSHTGVLQITV